MNCGLGYRNAAELIVIVQCVVACSRPQLNADKLRIVVLRASLEAGVNGSPAVPGEATVRVVWAVNWSEGDV